MMQCRISLALMISWQKTLKDGRHRANRKDRRCLQGVNTARDDMNKIYEEGEQCT
jgi:hypothetical protein